MTTCWLLLDVSNLAWRAHHALAHLSYGGEATETLYGIFRDIQELQSRFATDRIAFAFDGGIDKRTEIFPSYKKSRFEARQELEEEERQARRDLRKQIYRLRTKYLPEAGFQNIFWQEGYEADDVIASVCDQSGKGSDDIVIVSSDNDLLQCLSAQVILFNPVTKKVTTAKSFTDKWCISPSQWADVKALAGCSTDDVPGIHRVGEKTACKFLTGQLKPSHKTYNAIIEHPEVWERNLKLTRLPMIGTEKFQLVEDATTADKWDVVMQSLGMKSLLKRGK